MKSVTRRRLLENRALLLTAAVEREWNKRPLPIMPLDEVDEDQDAQIYFSGRNWRYAADLDLPYNYASIFFLPDDGRIYYIASYMLKGVRNALTVDSDPTPLSKSILFISGAIDDGFMNEFTDAEMCVMYWFLRFAEAYCLTANSVRQSMYHQLKLRKIDCKEALWR